MYIFRKFCSIHKMLFEIDWMILLMVFSKKYFENINILEFVKGFSNSYSRVLENFE